MADEYVYEDGICVIETSKYKTVELFLNFSIPYDLKTFLCLRMLDSYLGDYSKAYPDKERMSKAKDDLYGAAISCATRTRVDLIVFSIRYSFIDPRFLNDLEMKDFLDFFKECFHNVYFNEELLPEFKRKYKDRIRRHLDRPNYLALNRVMQILGEEDERLLINDIDHSAEIDEIGITDIKEVYDRLLKDFGLDICLVGSRNDTLLDFLKTLKTGPRYYLENGTYNIRDLGEIIEEKDVSQSNLNIIYETPYNRKHPDFYAFTLGNILFGVVPTSLLFEEVRERLSLCYYISVHDYKNRGLVRVHTAISAKDKDKVMKEIEKQIRRLIEMDYEPYKLELARRLFIDSLRGTVDDAGDYQDYLYNNILNGLDIPFAEYEKGLMNVSAQDISRVFSKYRHVLTYMLKGNRDEEDIQ